MTVDQRKPALAILLLALVPGQMLADQLIMKNGDVISGDISSIANGKVSIKPAYADEFAVNLADAALSRHAATLILAPAAAAVGADQPLGYRWGRRAYDVWTEAGARPLLQLFADAVVEPDVELEETGSG